MSTNIGQAELEVVPTAKGFGRQLETQLNGETPKAASNAGKKAGTGFAGGFGAALKRGGGLLAGGGLALGVAGLVKSSVKLEASFSKTMTQVAAATDAPASAMDNLNSLAKKLGAETTFSANDAAGAMLELGKAGITTSDIMGGALKGTLLLAAAGGTDLATASTIASNAMNTFNLRGKDMNTIAAALAGGANASSASVQSLGQALQQVGPGATNAGLSLQETVGVLSAFDAAGIKGSDAGTSLKTALARLVPQTDKASSAMRKYNLDFTDAKGNFVSITNVADQLRKGLGGLSEAERTRALTTIFGSDATRAATVLMKQGSKGIGEYIKATKDQNAAQKLAKANMSGTAGAMERLSGSVETAELAIGQALAPAVQKTANFLADDAIPAVTGFIEGMQDGTGAGGEFADMLETGYKVGKALFDLVDGLPGPVKKFAVQALIAAVVLNKLNSGFALVGRSGVGTFVTGMRNAETRMATTRKAALGLGSGLRQAGGAAGAVALVSGLKDLEAGSTKSEAAMGTLKTTAGGLATGFAVGGPVGAAVGGLAGLTYGLFKSTKDAGEAAKISVGKWQDYQATLDGVTASTTEATRAMIYERLQKSGLLEATRKLGLSDRQAVLAVTGNTSARGKLIHALDEEARTHRSNLALNVREALIRETGAVDKSRLAQLKKNLAIADTREKAIKARTALLKFQGQYNARVKMTGFGTIIDNLSTIKTLIADITGAQQSLPKGTTNKPATGLGGLLGIEGAGATGAIVKRPTLALIAESGPEALVPLNRTAGNEALPIGSSSSGQVAHLTITNWEQGTGYFEIVSDTRVGAHSGTAGMMRRARGA